MVIAVYSPSNDSFRYDVVAVFTTRFYIIDHHYFVVPMAKVFVSEADCLVN